MYKMHMTELRKCVGSLCSVAMAGVKKNVSEGRDNFCMASMRIKRETHSLLGSHRKTMTLPVQGTSEIKGMFRFVENNRLS